MPFMPKRLYLGKKKMTLDECKMYMPKLEKMLKDIIAAIMPDELKQKCIELKKEQEKEGFWENVDNAQKINKELSRLETKINKVAKLDKDYNDLVDMIDLCYEEKEEGESETIALDIKRLEKQLEEIHLETLLRGKYDSNSAILTLHAGAGGTEAQDWVSMLYRMYTRYAERNNFKVKEMDFLAGDEAGIKSVTFLIEGENAYGYLRAEMGVHRLVRISPFDSNARRHTSFASLEVMPEIDDEVQVVIRSEDLKVDTYRSSGAGGQHVNKTESAIRITHLPTGIVVACQNERSQIQNREQAMMMLKSKLIERQERETLEQAQQIKGDLKKIEWGSQIRSYVFCPYTLVKDHRTGFENSNITAVMDGDIDDFIFEYLKRS